MSESYVMLERLYLKDAKAYIIQALFKIGHTFKIANLKFLVIRVRVTIVSCEIVFWLTKGLLFGCTVVIDIEPK